MAESVPNEFIFNILTLRYSNTLDINARTASEWTASNRTRIQLMQGFSIRALAAAPPGGPRKNKLRKKQGKNQTLLIMPKVKTKATRYPEGWDLIEPYLDELEKEMRNGTAPLMFCIFRLFEQHTERLSPCRAVLVHFVIQHAAGQTSAYCDLFVCLHRHCCASLYLLTGRSFTFVCA